MKKKKISFAFLFSFMLMLILSVSASAALKLNKSSVTVELGKTYTLDLYYDSTFISPANAYWGSSDSSVASVNNGVVTPKKKGSTTITAMYSGMTATCLVSVVEQGKSNQVRYNVLILDTSGSITGNPLKKEEEAAKEFAKTVLNADGTNYVALVGMGYYTATYCQFTTSYSTFEYGLQNVISSQRSDGATPMNRAFELAGELLARVPGGSNVVKNIVLCSDGLPEYGDKTENGRYSAADHRHYAHANTVYNTDVQLKNKGYFVYALGFFHNTYGADKTFGERLMKDLASSGNYFVISGLDDLKPALQKIASKITVPDKTTTKYKVYFKPNGGTCSKKSKKVTNGKTYGTLPTPERSGYTFLGWFTKKSGGVQITKSTTVNLTKKQKLYAHWLKKEIIKKTGVVTDAKTGDVLKKATLKFRLGYDKKSGTIVKTTKTDSKGNFNVSLEKGKYTMQVTKSGYIKSYFNIDCTKDNTETVSVSPKIASTEYRIVLSWGASPNDLDAHLTGPLSSGSGRFHVYYRNKTASDNGQIVAELDIDDRSAYGPETTTIHFQAAAKGTYYFYVHDFSNRGSSDNSALGASGARVIVYKGNKQAASYTVPVKKGTQWQVFKIKNGKIKKINKMVYSSTFK